MQRRSAVKTIALTIGGSIVLPSWANAWSKKNLSDTSFRISVSQEILLADIVETIIPKTDTLGAKELNINQFALKMIGDCYDKNSQTIFSKGLDLVDITATKDFSKTFTACDATQKLAVLNKLSNSENGEEKAFLRLIKNLTIQGYLNSEYVMTNLRIYEFAPARYHGCVPVKK